MSDRPYQLAIIPCTARKNKQGRTAITLYHGGPFSLMVRHAALQAERLLIMSAKYGLLEPHDPVEYYDLYLPDLDGLEREDLVERVNQQARMLALTKIVKGVSYLPEAYFSVLAEAAPSFAAHLDRPFKGVRMMTAWKRMSQDLRTEGTTKRGLFDKSV